MSSSSSLETTGERPAFFLPVTRGDPNDPCASNDAEDWTLVQAEFFSGGGSEDGGGLRGRGRDRRRLLRGRRANDGEDGDVRKWVDDDGFVLDLMKPCTTTPPPPTNEEATEAATTEATTTNAATTAAAAAKDEETGSPDEVDPAIDDKEDQVDEAFDDSEGVPSATEAPEVVATELPEEEAPDDAPVVETSPDGSEGGGDIMHTTPSPPVEDDGPTSDGPPSDAPPASFFGCLGGASFEGGAATADLSAVAAPLKLSYDYELRTSEVLTSEVLARFESDVAKDLADRLGLLDCAFGEEPTRRRILRAEVEGGTASVLALDGKPVDDDMAGAYRCEVPVQLARPTSCAPMRGYMTAWVPRSSDVDRAALEASLLALVEEGMEADAYVNGDVVKASYVGARPPPSDAGDDGGDPSVGGAKETDETRRVQDPDASSDGGLPVMVIVGISVSALALLLAIVLTVVYVRKRRRAQYFSDGPRDSDDANGGGSSAARAALARQRSEDLADPDDEHLLATDEKMDLRSVHSESTGSSTENHVYDEREMANRYDTLYGRNDASIYREGSRKIVHTLSSTTVDYGEPVEAGGDSSDVTPKAGAGATTVLTAGSSLAAMGVIGSNLAARSFGSTDGRPDPGSPSSAEEVPPTPTSATIEHTPTDATPFSESDSHVGTVREEEESVVGGSVATSTTPGADSNARVNPPPREEARSYPWDPRTGAVGLPAIDGAPSMDSMDRDTFRSMDSMDRDTFQEERGPVGWA